MTGRASLSLADQLAAAQDWWREAGVDCAFADEPTRWLRDPAEEQAQTSSGAPAPIPPPAATQPPKPKASIGGDPASWPQDLASFSAWWLAEPSLETGGTQPRIPPRGPAGAKLMILVPAPEAQDEDRLLSGPQGALLESFLAAAEVASGDVYLAAGLPRRTPLADMPALAEEGLGAVTLHHIALARPDRLLILGRDVLPLVGHDPTQNPVSLGEVNHGSGIVPAMVGRSLELMLQRPATRSRFWRRWLDWTG